MQGNRSDVNGCKIKSSICSYQFWKKNSTVLMPGERVAKYPWMWVLEGSFSSWG